MTEPVEFASFYQLLKSVKQGSEERIKELEWMLAEYEHANDSSSAYDELGQIFCHIGLMELYEYTGIDNIKYISEFEEIIWKYLETRYGVNLLGHMVDKMKKHSEKHNLDQRVSKKWSIPITDIADNIEGLATYVAEGIIEVIV